MWFNLHLALGGGHLLSCLMYFAKSFFRLCFAQTWNRLSCKSAPVFHLVGTIRKESPQAWFSPQSLYSLNEVSNMQCTYVYACMLHLHVSMHVRLISVSPLIPARFLRLDKFPQLTRIHHNVLWVGCGTLWRNCHNPPQNAWLSNTR